jgi:protein tyrosine/serine phosphatase
MKQALIRVLATALALLIVGSLALARDEPEREAAIRRFEQVAPGLYRGGQPTAAGFGFLKWRGIRTIINLREEFDERAVVEALGFKYVYIPLDAGDPIHERAIKTFLGTVNDPANQPVFVHCQRGSDRTGIMVGFFRIAMQGWDAERAYEEARLLGMHWWYRRLKRQLYEFAGRRDFHVPRRETAAFPDFKSVEVP